MPQELRFENEFFLVFPTIFRVRLKFLLSLTKSNNFPRLSILSTIIKICGLTSIGNIIKLYPGKNIVKPQRKRSTKNFSRTGLFSKVCHQEMN